MTPRLFLHVKNNISRAPQGLAFRLEQRLVGSDEKGDFVASCIAWEGNVVEKTADEALRANDKKEQTATADATEFLTNVLASGPVKVTIRARKCEHQDSFWESQCSNFPRYFQ